jgi:hypothetical protein
MPNAPGNIPRSSSQSGKMFTVGEPGDDLAPWLDYENSFGIGYGTPPQIQLGANLAKPGFMLRPPYRTVIFLNLVSYGYYDIIPFETTLVNITALNNILTTLKDSDLTIAIGDANQVIPEIAFGNDFFPDNWPKNDTPPNEPLTPGWEYISAWLWSLTLGLSGKPKQSPIDLLVFIIAWTDYPYADPSVTETDWSLISYHDSWFYYPISEEHILRPEQPTPKYIAHYNRFVSLVPKLSRYRAVIIRPTNLTYRGFDDIVTPEAEPHLSAHFHNAVNGTGGYAALGPGLDSFGVELMELNGSFIDQAAIIKIIKEHFGLS